MYGAAADAAAYGDNIDKMSQKMGLSIEAYQEWDAIMQHSGTSIESMQASMKTLANAVETGNGAFERLGMTEEEISQMSNEDLFAATITALQNVDNETERTYLAGQLLGRGATELGALLNTSAEETEAMRQRVHELGGVMSTETVKSAAAFQDSLQDLQTAASGFTRGALAELMPGITSIMDGITSIFTGDSGGLAQISEGINQTINSLSEKIPEIIAVGGQIVTSLIQSISSNLPEIISGATMLIGQLISALISAAPQLIEAGAQLVLQLILGLTQNLPQVLESVGQVLSTLWGVIVEYGPQLLAAGFELIVQLGAGILSAVGEVVGPMAEVAAGAIQAWGEKVKDFVNAGIQVISGIVEGIKSAASQVWDTLWGIISGAVDKVKAFFGIKSPSKLFAYFGKMIDEGFAKGIEDNVGTVAGAMDTITEQTSGVQLGVQRAASSGLGLASGLSGINAGNLGQLASAIVNGIGAQLANQNGNGEAVIYMDGDRVGRAVLPSVRYWGKITPEVSMG
jgi:phage-related protein